MIMSEFADNSGEKREMCPSMAATSREENREEKIRDIVNKEFEVAIERKREELRSIDERILRVRQCLQLVRYSVVKNFYSGLQTQQTQDNPETAVLHPAVQGILHGKAPKHDVSATSARGPIESSSHCQLISKVESGQGQHLTYWSGELLPSQSGQSSGYIASCHGLGGEGTAVPPNCSNQGGEGTAEPPSCSYQGDDVADVPPSCSSQGDSVTAVPPSFSSQRDEVTRSCYVPPRPTPSRFPTQLPRGSHLKYKRRIVIGNVSKWIPESQRDGEATHKWMVYVRGDKDNPDLPELEKVVFGLHPSYQPHHVVEVANAPFQITRRGWGEFPLRVQLIFKNRSDKPMEATHFLKLDRTFSEHQTLGQETNLDVFLFSQREADSLHEEPEKAGGEKGEGRSWLEEDTRFLTTQSEGFLINH